jgi:hypothetical protein
LFLHAPHTLGKETTPHTHIALYCLYIIFFANLKIPWESNCTVLWFFGGKDPGLEFL